MKKITLLFFALISTMLNAQTVDINLDATEFNTGLGWLNVFQNPKDGNIGGFEFGSGWGVPDLVSVVDTGANTVTLKPNRIGDTAEYWQTAGVLEGNKIIEANHYLENDALIGNIINFHGKVLSSTLDGSSLSIDYAYVAFIKIFAPDYSSSVTQTYDLATVGDFTVTMDATASAVGSHVQYGFQVVGPNINSDASFDTDYANLGSIVVEGIVDITTDATLSDLTVGGTTVTGFDPSTLTYNVELPDGTTVVPTVVGTPTQSTPATAVTTDATELPGASTVLVTAQDGNTTETYTVNFSFPSTNTDCAGTSSDAVNGTFTYNYSFVTSGTDVTITFEVIEAFTGLVGQLKQGTVFTGMTNVGGQTFEITLADQVDGTDLTFAFYGPYAGAALETIEYTYTVGDDCLLGTKEFEATDFNVYPNPSLEAWNIKTSNTVINAVKVFDILGKQVISLSPESTEVKIDGSSLTSGIYIAKIATPQGVSNIRLVRK